MNGLQNGASEMQSMLVMSMLMLMEERREGEFEPRWL